jgi:hypothetical protein
MENMKLNWNEFPEDILENNILSYLNLKDLFSTVRGVNSDWSNMMKNLWCERIKSEMIEQVHSIDFLYEKEVLTKTYEFKVKYLINYKKLFNLYLANIDIVTIIKLVLTQYDDIKVKDLLKSFFNFIEFVNPIQMIDSNVPLEELVTFLDQEKVVTIEKVMHLMNIDSMHTLNADGLKEFKDSFLTLDKDYLEQLNDYTKLLYSFLFGIIEFQILKVDVLEIRKSIEKLIEKIQNATEKWPKKKIFYERAYKLLLYTKYSFFY